jgi:2-iminobutanoate/2-iminopropanoate deaminase
MKHVITADKGPAAAGPYSPGLVVGDWIYLSGQGGFDPDTDRLVSGDIEGQTEQTFRNIQVLLEAAGASLADIASCLVHIADLGEFERFNAVYERQFPGIKPVRTTVRADLVAAMKVEVTVVARKAA